MAADTGSDPGVTPSESISLPPAQQFDRRLLAYALAGAGAVTLAPSASAEVVYTKADVELTDGILRIDLDHDGIRDFMVSNLETATYYNAHGRLEVTALSNPRVAVLGFQRNRLAMAAQSGFPIGPNSPRPFVDLAAGPMEMASVFCTYNYCHIQEGRCANVARRFLGIRFEINGEVHYGWARFAVRARTSAFPLVKANLTGYAYETEPNKTILAGDRGFGADSDSESGDPEGASLEGDHDLVPASLGLLSFGSAGMDAWRRKQDLKSTPGN